MEKGSAEGLLHPLTVHDYLTWLRKWLISSYNKIKLIQSPYFCDVQVLPVWKARDRGPSIQFSHTVNGYSNNSDPMEKCPTVKLKFTNLQLLWLKCTVIHSIISHWAFFKVDLKNAQIRRGPLTDRWCWVLSSPIALQGMNNCQPFCQFLIRLMFYDIIGRDQ